jgi:hypothetical protein
VLLAVGCAVAWVQRSNLLAWYRVRGLLQADEAQQALWLDRVESLGEPCLPGLIAGAGQESETVCRNAQSGLFRLARAWGPTDPRSAHLAQGLARSFDRLSRAGQVAALEGVRGCFVGQPMAVALVPQLVPACGQLLEGAAASPLPAVQQAGLELCGDLMSRDAACEARPRFRTMIQAGLRSPEVSCRLRAIRLSLQPGVELLESVVGLLRDPAPEVRRAALLAVGPAEQLIRDENLLPWLHDPDAEVRRICEDVLRDRGLRPEHLHLGRLLTDPHPGTRLQVLDHLGQAADLDPGLWLRRLSQDSSPAVRAAALRAMSQQRFVNLSDRIEQMAQSDPSPTVCQLARFYRQQHHPTGIGER